jgi:hypothetical protein
VHRQQAADQLNGTRAKARAVDCSAIGRSVSNQYQYQWYCNCTQKQYWQTPATAIPAGRTRTRTLSSVLALRIEAEEQNF